MFYIYILSDANRENIQTGYTKDILKAVTFYKKLPRIDTGINQMVYLEGMIKLDQAKTRMNEIFKLTADQKIELIKSVNPDWIELIPGQNIELKLSIK